MNNNYEQFCFWLKGFFESQKSLIECYPDLSDALDEKRMSIIVKQLDKALKSNGVVIADEEPEAVLPNGIRNPYSLPNDGMDDLISKYIENTKDDEVVQELPSLVNKKT